MLGRSFMMFAYFLGIAIHFLHFELTGPTLAIDHCRNPGGMAN